jgi:hypothetical protein
MAFAAKKASPVAYVRGSFWIARRIATLLDQGREASWAVRAAAVHRRSALTTGLNYIYKYREGVPFHRQKGTVSPSRGYRFTVPRGYRFTVDNLRNPQGYSLPLDEGYPGLHRGTTFG